MPDIKIPQPAQSPAVEQPAMVQDQWEPSNEDSIDFADQSAPPEWLHQNVTRALNENTDHYDIANAVENPSTPMATLDAVHNHYAANPELENENFGERPVNALLNHPKAKVEWARNILDRKRAGESVRGDYMKAALAHKEIKQDEINELIASSMHNPKDRAQLDASRTDPAFLLEQHKQLDAQPDSGDQPWGDSKKDHYLQELAEHPGHTPETLEATRKLLMSHPNGYSQAQNFLNAQHGLNHNQIEEFYNKHQPKAVEEYDDGSLARSAFDHPNVDPSFLSSRAVAGSEGEKAVALSHEKLPYESQIRAMNEGFSDPEKSDNHRQLASNDSLPSDIASRLLEAHGPQGEHGKFLNHPNVPQEAVSAAWENSAKTPTDARAFLGRKTLPPKVLSDIVTSGKPAEAVKAVNHPSADQALIDLASGRKAKDVQEAVAAHPLGQDKYLAQHVMSGKVSPEEYIQQHDEKMPEEAQAKAHQMYADRIADPKSAHYSDPRQNPSAFYFLNSPHISEEQKQGIIDRSLKQNKDMTAASAWGSDNLKAHASILTQAAEEGNDDAANAVLSSPKLIASADIDEVESPKFLNTAIEKATNPDSIRNNDTQAALAQNLIKNPNLEPDQVKKLIDTHGKDLISQISSGYILANASPEERQSFFSQLSSTPNGKLATLAAPNAPDDTKAAALNTMSPEELIDFTNKTPEASVSSAFHSLPVEQRIAMVKGSHNDNAYTDYNTIPAAALSTLSPRTAPLSTLLDGTDKHSVAAILKNLPQSYKDLEDPQADALMVNQHPSYLPSYNANIKKASPTFFQDHVAPHLNPDNAYNAIDSLLGSKTFKENSDNLDLLVDPAQSPYLSEDARGELVSKALMSNLISPKAKDAAMQIPSVKRSMLDNSQTSLFDKKQIATQFADQPVMSSEDLTAVSNAVFNNAIFSGHESPEQDALYSKLMQHAFNDTHSDSLANITNLAQSYARGKPAEKVIKSLGDVFNKINASPNYSPEAKHRAIISSYNNTLSDAKYGEYSKISFGLAEQVADSVMANNDLPELFSLGTSGSASAPVFVDAINKIAEQPEFLSPEHLSSFYSAILQDSGNSNLKPQNFAKLIGAGLNSSDPYLAEQATGVLSKGIEYSSKMDPEDFDSLVTTGFNKIPELAPEMRDRVAAAIATSKASPADRLRAINLISDTSNRRVNVENDILNSDAMIAKARTAPWAATQLTSKFDKLSPDFQDKAADAIAEGMLNSGSDDIVKSNVVANLLVKGGATISSTATKRLFSPLSFAAQTKVLEGLPGSSFGNYSAFSDQYLANAKIAAYQNLDPTTGQQLTDPQSALDAIGAMSMLLPKGDNFGEADQASIMNMQNESAKMISHMLDKDFDINQNGILVEHLDGILNSKFARDNIDPANVNKVIASALNKAHEVRISPSMQRRMMNYKGVDQKNINTLIAREPSLISHLATNPEMNADKINAIKNVLGANNLEKLHDNDIASIGKNMLQNAHAFGTHDLAFPVAVKLMSHMDDAHKSDFLKDIPVLDEDKCQHLLEKGFTTPGPLANSNHGGKSIYDQFIKSGDQAKGSLALNDHFDDRGADKLMESGNANDEGDMVHDNVQFMLQKASGKLSKQKFDEICKKFPAIIKENPEIVSTSPHLDYNSLQNLHEQIAPDYAKFVERGKEFPPTYLNVKYGAKLFRENYPQTLPEKVDNVNGRKLIKSQSSRNGADRLQQAMSAIPPQGIAWAEFKRANKQMENWPEVKSLFMAKNNKPVMPEDFAQAIAQIPEQQYHITYDSWDGLQRHNNKQNLVMQLNTGESFDKVLGEDPKLWNFYQMVQKSANGTDGTGSCHPVTPHTVGWVRIDTSSPEHFMVEEFQSDFNQKLKKHIKVAFERNPKGTVTYGEHNYTQDEANDCIDKIEKAFEGWMPSAYQALEALAKKQGVKKIFVHGVGVRKSLSGVSPDQHVATFDEAYKKQPQKMGYQQCNYADYPSYSEEIQRSDIDKKCWVKDVA